MLCSKTKKKEWGLIWTSLPKWRKIRLKWISIQEKIIFLTNFSPNGNLNCNKTRGYWRLWICKSTIYQVTTLRCWTEWQINRGFSKWNPVSLTKRPKYWTDSYFWIHKFRNEDSFKHIFVEVILLSEFTNSEIGITSTFRCFYQANRLSGFHFEKSLLTSNLHLRLCPGSHSFIVNDILTMVDRGNKVKSWCLRNVVMTQWHRAWS